MSGIIKFIFVCFIVNYFLVSRSILADQFDNEEEFELFDADGIFEDLFPFLSKEEAHEYVNISTIKLLNERGLDFLIDNFASFFHLFDNTTLVLHHISKEDNFRILNEIIDGMKRSFITTTNEMMNSRNAPTGAITVSAMSTFIDRQETHFNDLLRAKVPKGLDDELWGIFFTRIHLVFDSFKLLYKMSVEKLPTPLQLSWSYLQMVAPFLDFIPTSDLLQHAHFEWLLLMPAQTKKILHDLIVTFFSIERSQMTKMFINLVASFKWNELFDRYNQNKEHNEL